MYPSVRPSRVADAARAGVEQLELRRLLSVECITIDFETDSSGNPLVKGQVIDNEFAGYGITVTTNAPVTHPAMIFDSSDPSGGDVDLGSPNEDFGGPGIGEGGELGEPGANFLSHENILIISEDADSSDPDDNQFGGKIHFLFDEPVTIQDAGLLDIEDYSGIRLYNSSNVLIATFMAQELGDNSFQRIVMNIDEVKRMEVFTHDSLGLTDFTFCREDNGEEPVKEGRMTGGGSIFLPAGAIGGAAGTRVTHGFQLHCATPPEEVNNRLQVNWGKPAQRFHLENLTSVTCIDTALIQAPPDAPIDTLIATGVGRFSGTFNGTKYNKASATISFVFTDAGEPGVNDRASYLIQISGGPVVLNTDSNDAGTDPDQIQLTFGNHQAHNEIPKYTSTFLTLQTNVVSKFTSLDATNINEMKSMSLVNDLLNLFNQQEATVPH